jgi:hypothetical protein
MQAHGFEGIDAGSILLKFYTFQVSTFIDCWRSQISNGKQRNYYHFLAVEAAIQIEHSGSIWKYASDITESYVHIIKDCFLKYTTRGGSNRHWTKQVHYNLCIDLLLLTYISGDDKMLHKGKYACHAFRLLEKTHSLGAKKIVG